MDWSGRAVSMDDVRALPQRCIKLDLSRSTLVAQDVASMMACLSQRPLRCLLLRDAVML